ncbi:hypothetical protein [Arenimonas donghaensis]|uniref:Uncharacterized protein n=1 Tax=Arenimonas donghaensis DSM 18148 = HO3-R19 TaxID=1121014 RepID=A0A087MJZ9_9GAMM|nr:hypothetical protein [Arenimonas donghaensis]KFL37202.1 hypothetical protein N788_10980 [Arenimonas donghaensis DSM 18148 = HO3-R19]
MTDPTPPLPTPSDDHLRLLAVFHYVFAGFALLGMGFLALHYGFMTQVMDSAHWQDQANPPPEGLFDVFVWFYAVMGLMLLLGLVLNVIAARSLRARRRWVFCAVVAGLNCLQFPVGTVLGVFTLVVINRADVRASFRD